MPFSIKNEQALYENGKVLIDFQMISIVDTINLKEVLVWFWLMYQ